jgi:uncharacterized protein (TIGR02118 family)
MDHDEFADYWINRHGPLAAKIPGLRGYSISVAHAVPFSEEVFPWDGLVEMYFDDGEALEAGLASREGVVAVDDVENFAERKGFMLTQETVIIPVERHDAPVQTGLAN